MTIGDAYVAAGHYIQKFDTLTGTFLGNVTTTWIGGTSNTELHFGNDGNLYGLGSNSWAYKYDFGVNQTSVFFKPTGDRGATGLTLGPDSNWYVAAGHYIQKFDGLTGAFLGDVTTNWNGGSSNTELHFGADGNLYGLGANSWVYKYDFGASQTTVFFKPSGDMGATGLALGTNSNWYVAAGHYIQEFDGLTGAFVDDVTLGWPGGTSNTELQFGPKGNLYGLGSNGWVFEYDFVADQTSVLFKPSGDMGATGLAIRPVPESAASVLILLGGIALLRIEAPRRSCAKGLTLGL